MNTIDGSEECQQVAQMTLGYLEALVEGARTDEAREMLMDWQHFIEKYKQKNGDT
jgi:hypothetical protein